MGFVCTCEGVYRVGSKHPATHVGTQTPHCSRVVWLCDHICDCSRSGKLASWGKKFLFPSLLCRPARRHTIAFVVCSSCWGQKPFQLLWNVQKVLCRRAAGPGLESCKRGSVWGAGYLHPKLLRPAPQASLPGICVLGKCQGLLRPPQCMPPQWPATAQRNCGPNLRRACPRRAWCQVRGFATSY